MPYDLTFTASTMIAVTGSRTGEGVDETRSLQATTHASAHDGAQPQGTIRTRAAWSSDPFPGPAARDRAASVETR